MQARGEPPPTAGTERADHRDEAREQDPRGRAQRHEGECLRGGLQHGCGERRAEGAFDRAEAGGDVVFSRDRARGRLQYQERRLRATPGGAETIANYGQYAQRLWRSWRLALR